MKRLLLAAVAIAALPLAVAAPASATPATHEVYVEDYDAYEQFAAGDAEPCVSRAGTFHEVRSGQIELVTVTTGPQAGEAHLNGVVAGSSSTSPTISRCRPTPAPTARSSTVSCWS